MIDSLLIDELIKVLEKEIEVYDYFLKLQQKKTGIIIKGEMSSLEDTTKKEHNLINKVNELEKERETIVAKVIRHSKEEFQRDKKLSDFTITAIIGYLKEEKGKSEQTKKLKKYKETIVSIINEVKEINETNSNLIKNSLDYINFSINLLTSIDGNKTKYGNDGKEGKTERRSLFDVKL